MLFELVLRARVGKPSSQQVGRTLPDGQIQTLDGGRVQSRGVLGVVERVVESPCGSEPRSAFDLHDAIVATGLDDLRVESGWAEDTTDGHLVEIESVRDDQGRVAEAIRCETSRTSANVFR